MNIPLFTLETCFSEKNRSALPMMVESLDNLPGYAGKAHQHDYFQIIFPDKGSIQHIIEQDTYMLGPGNISVIFPRQIHRAVFSPDVSGLALMFDEVMFCSDLLKKELKSYTLDLYKKLNYVGLSGSRFNNVRNIAEQINILYQDITPIRQEQIRFYIKILLLQLIEYTHEKTLPRKDMRKVDIYSGFKVQIEDHYKEVKTVEGYASLMGVSAGKLNKVCREEAGMTALSVIHERIMVEIRRMFLYGSCTNKEIAYRLGFTSPSALNKFIYAKTGKTPTEMRISLSGMDK